MVSDGRNTIRQHDSDADAWGANAVQDNTVLYSYCTYGFATKQAFCLLFVEASRMHKYPELEKGMAVASCPG